MSAHHAQISQDERRHIQDCAHRYVELRQDDVQDTPPPAPQTYCERCTEPLYRSDERRSFALCPKCEAQLDSETAQQEYLDAQRDGYNYWRRS